MTLWAVASRGARVAAAGLRQRPSTLASAVGGTRQMSMADKDNILPVRLMFGVLYWNIFAEERGRWRW